MATLENFRPGPALDFSGFQKNRALEIAREKLRIDAEIRRGTLSVAEGNLAIKQLEAETAAAQTQQIGGLADELGTIFPGENQGLPLDANQIRQPGIDGQGGGLDALITRQLAGVPVGEDIVPSTAQADTIQQPQQPQQAQQRRQRTFTPEKLREATKIFNKMERAKAGSSEGFREIMEFANTQEIDFFKRDMAKQQRRAVQLGGEPIDKQRRLLAHFRRQDEDDGLDVSAIEEMQLMNNETLQLEISSDLFLGDLGKKAIELAQTKPEPPKTREIKRGDDVITEQFDPATGTFKEIGRSPRFQKRDPLVTISTGEKEGEKLGARSDAAVRDEVRGNARTASRQLGKVRSLSKLLEATGTGALTQFAPELGRLIPGFDFTNEQAAQAQISQFALDQLGAFKGPTSDRELAFVNQTIQNLGNTPEANRIITRSLENVIFLSQQENRQFNDFVKGKGKPRDFIFNFQEVIFPNHPAFGNVTLDDIQTTAFNNQVTMERILQEMRNR